MIRYSIQEIKTIVSQLNCLVDIVMFQRAILLLGFCYTEEELIEINRRTDMRILYLTRNNGRVN